MDLVVQDQEDRPRGGNGTTGDGQRGLKDRGEEERGKISKRLRVRSESRRRRSSTCECTVVFLLRRDLLSPWPTAPSRPL